MQIACERKPNKAQEKQGKADLVEWVWALQGKGKSPDAAEQTEQVCLMLVGLGVGTPRLYELRPIN